MTSLEAMLAPWCAGILGLALLVGALVVALVARQ